MNKAAKIRFWGTRGALAKPGTETVRYGGNTACVQLTSPEGALLVIDCGTGAHGLGQSLLANANNSPRGSILISHTHWDHIQGFPFFAPLFVKGAKWDIYGPAGLGESLRDTLAGQMQYAYFPLTLDDMGADIRFHDLAEGDFKIDDIRITTRYLNHPVLTLGYRLEMGGITVVYACDHEPFFRNLGYPNFVNESDQRHIEFLAGADLLIHDAQFTDSEYASKKGWGHSPYEYVLEAGRLAGVNQIAFTHHDPLRTDDALDKIIRDIQAGLLAEQSSIKAFAAAEGQVVELQQPDEIKHAGDQTKSRITSAGVLATPNSTVLLLASDANLSSLLTEAARAEGVLVSHARNENAVLQLAQSVTPALILIEDRLPEMDAVAVCKNLRAAGDQKLKNVAIVIVTDNARIEDGKDAGVTDWLVRPFSAQYAKAHIQAWLMRSACRWSRAPFPPDESTRIAALHKLAILDTPPEERFDRITRIAASIAGVPIAMVSLVDQDRQWFKSCQGLESSENSREVSFCSHTIANRKPLIISDTLRDDRFADNPLVTGAPRIRFYAGFPVFHDDGSCLGSLCLIDTRPRQLPDAVLHVLKDMAFLAQQEINAKNQGRTT